MIEKHPNLFTRNYCLWLLVCVGLFFLSGCDKKASEPEGDSPITMNDLVIDNEFEFATTQNVDLNVLVSDNRNEALKNVKLELYTADPDSDGGQLIVTGATGADGRFTRSVTLPAGTEKVYLRSVHIGVMPGGYVPVLNGSIRATFGYENTGFIEDVEEKSAPAPKSGKSSFAYKYLGQWDSQGRPLYLESEGDVVDSELLDRINASLPESRPVPQYHPDYLATDVETNMEFTSTSDVWVSFLHEGAGWRNVFGFYTYDVNNPPQSKSDIDSVTIVFPNVSAQGSGGDLRVGDKVYLGQFDENTGVGLFLFGNGWKNGITEGRHTLFTHSGLNPETDPSLQQHNVLLNDDQNERIILGFEDLNRQWSSCDNDFNDAIFMITANPYSAVKTEDMSPLDVTSDVDGDGISDYYDDYPNDPDKAFDNFYPSENSYGTLGYEDQWPSQGDYDFNDLVVDYRYNEVTNVNNQVVEVGGTFVLKAVGAAYENGFGFQLDIDPSNVASVIGQKVTNEYLSFNSNGTEAGQSKATIIVFDNSAHRMPKPSGYLVNTEEEAPYVTPDTVQVTVALTNAVNRSLIGEAPYNPFLIANKRRGYEVHLMNGEPTDLADPALFGTGDDASQPQQGQTYRTSTNLPWALHLPEEFVYPLERVEILRGYPFFADWAQSNGTTKEDWYKNETGNRDMNNLYAKP